VDKKFAKNKTDDRVRACPCILGIDPGLDGGIAVVDTGRRILALHPMPSSSRIVSRTRRRFYDTFEFTKLLRELKEEFKLVCAAVERVSASPQMGVTSAFSFGLGYGIIHGALEALDIKVIPVEPTVWKRKMATGANKKVSVQRAVELFGRNEPMKEGQAEAALIAWHVLAEVDALS
jgi:crossover junction endodeoxyribonuclease RuvC